MKILLVCMQYDYGDPKRGLSYEYCNFYLSLKDMGHEVIVFDYMAELKRHGNAAMNRKIVELSRAELPHLAIFSLYTDQLEPEAVNEVRHHTKTFCFFHDDTWRIDYSRFWARHFDWFSTPDIYGERKYAAIGLNNALYFPFGCNERLYRKMDVPIRYDVSFVGGWHPYREWLVKRLVRAGVKVKVAGHRWPGGMLTHEEMIELFNASKINLNLSNSASWDARYLLASPQGIVNRLRSKKVVEQLKARHFEINGCGAFQLSYFVEGLEKCFEIGTELAIYTDPDDLVEKVRLYLVDDDARGAIADAGYRRALDQHTYSRRFRQVFDRIGLADV